MRKTEELVPMAVPGQGDSVIRARESPTTSWGSGTYPRPLGLLSSCGQWDLGEIPRGRWTAATAPSCDSSHTSHCIPGRGSESHRIWPDPSGPWMGLVSGGAAELSGGIRVSWGDVREAQSQVWLVG